MGQIDFYRGLDEWRHVPFSWENNCCHFAKDMCGRLGREIDIEIPVLYSQEDAEAWLKEQGYKGLYGLLRSLFGNPINPLQGNRGDLVMRDSLTVGVLDRNALFLGENGLIELPRKQCKRAFRV